MRPGALPDLLGITYPIVQGGMSWVSRHALAAAVSEAGALGVIGSGGMEPDELREEIRALRRLTGRAFAVNVPLIDVRVSGTDDVAARLVDVVVEERVPIVVTGAGSPARFTPRLQQAGARVLHVVPSVRLARKAEGAGVDALVAEGFEAGGHVQGDGLSTFALVPQVVDAVSIPVVAAGGIADGRGVVAALALGAAGVQLGTRFIATHECNAHVHAKNALVEASDEGTLVYCRESHTSRALATRAVRAMVEMEARGVPIEEILEYRGRSRARRACLGGDLEEGILPAGASVGLVRELCSVDELVRALVDRWRAVVAELHERLPARRRGAA